MTTAHAEQAMSQDNVLEVEDLKKRFGGLLAVSSLSFSVSRGKVTSLIGPNGAGKTTSFNTLTGVLRSDGGRVILDGDDITRMSATVISSLGLARTFQNVRLVTSMTCLDNVAAARYSRTRARLWQVILHSRGERRERMQTREEAQTLLARVGLAGVENRYPNELPYGDQRRLEIARALALDPKVLILDEPTAGMIPREARAVVGLMEQLISGRMAILLIEHNMKIVMSVSDHVVVMNQGKKIAEGRPEEVRRNPAVVEAYLGEEES